MYELTVRVTQALVSFAPLAFKLFFAACQNAVLRRSSYVRLRFCAWWSDNHELRRFEDAAAADAAEHECLCRVLATTRPVRFPRRQQAA